MQTVSDFINRARAWWFGVDIREIHRQQTLIRFEQFGGVDMKTWLWEEIFLNEMNTHEFITMILCCGSGGDED